ncbi:hypothetical protein BT67DRAFT_449782 [Trichocladium antarcticum]|uniref:DUF2415 domain-containing protein n=1 Tax=Trichocladium antarcticum TaxID=1450529 RepID=A0AAN6UK20_9PEZI|nr:hypothetical protein BT67DRAFT_449782 [Trichocladium antarcticum]
MAVSNDICTPTEDLILAKPRRHFRTSVRWQHWQLRSLVGSEGQNVVYYATGTDHRSVHVERLNTKTRETETVKRLSFMPRCLVARNGWVCCGGELGAFSAFRAGEGNTPDHAETEPEIEPDEPISLTMDLSEATATLLAQVRSEKNLLARSIAFGKDRVNCITLWFPPTLVQLSEGAYDEEVAVLANNDSSVIVARLRDHEALDKITYPDFMNRGVLSPDGRLLIAISDDPYLYVHERKKKKPDAGVAARTADQPAGSFAACFSSTGRYLAVGTQYGTISIFDVAALTLPGEDALLTSFTTSRPNSEFGAVRDMAFSPGPIDLLAWTEDRGRVGVVDIRTGFTSRQFLDLDRDNDFEHLAVTDRSAIDPRLIERIDQGESSSSGLANMLEHSVESRQNRHSEEQESLGRYNIPLTPEETAVLEAIQDFRRRQVQYNPASNRTGTESGSNSGSGSSNGGGGGGGSGAGTGTGTRSLWVTQPGEGARATEGARPRERTASVSRAVTEILENIRDQRERIRDSQERIRTREESNAERRRYATNPFSGSTNALGTAGSGNSERRGLVARLIANTSSGPTGGWDNVEALAAYLMREWEDNPTRRVLGTYMPSSHIRPGPYDTAGLSWSEDGDILFVGAENGIFEFHVNLFGRKQYPSITLC